ncbi:MAG: DNA polymerase I [Candidatus Sungbacteria bacterium]|nr:DNA polymerase I [Candidatus Sungbacteria bacterium]
MKRFVLIDSHAIIHRAYHALPPLTTPAGEPVQAVYGFTTMLMRILAELKPDYIAAAFDMAGPTFRHAAYERYKAQRPKAPSELISQFSKVRDVARAFGIPVLELQGYEADDVIGTVAKKMEKQKGVETIVVTGDMDALQLIRPGLKVYTMRKGISDTVTYDEKAVRERFGFGPEKLVDYKGLRGDPSDNIPGVKGVGEKTAAELIKAFGSIDEVYKALKKKNKKIGPALATRLAAGEEDAKFSRELARIRHDAPIEFSLDNAVWSGMKPNGEVRELFTKFGFASLLRRLDEAGSMNQESGIRKKEQEPEFPLLGRRGGAVYVCDEKFLSDPANTNLFSRGTDWYASDAKSAIKLLRTAGIAIKDITFDVLLAAYVAGQFARDFSYRAIAAREIGDAHASPDRLFDVAGALEQKLSQGRLRAIFEDIEMPLIPILADMEERGIMIDRQFLKTLARSVDARIDSLTEAIYKSAGEKFNIASPKQLSQILFEKLGLATRGLRKTAKGGVISTRESELEKLRTVHPIVDEILSYRELAKLKSTYIDVLPRLADKKTGRVHTTFNQTATSTGRLSSNNPNLQNIPILSETGRELRKAFVASPGFTLVCFDYSQIELRVAAHMADDKKMIAAFREGLDIHRMTAAEIYNVALEDVTPELRRAAKTLNFGVLYGMGASALAENAGMSRDDAGHFIEEYFRDFSGIREYIEKTKRLAREQGFVESLFGRRRYIPEINSPNFRVRAEAERMAVNMPIQATATGDIIKMAMIAGAAWIKKEKLEDDVRLLLQVHDELVFEIREQVMGTAAPKIKKIMEGVAHLSVPIVVDIKAGPNWGEQKSL